MRTNDAGTPTKRTSFDKGLSVLTWIADHDGVRADEIAAGLDLPLSSVYRYLRSLRDAGFASENDGRYSGGHRLAPQQSRSGHRTIEASAEPYLQHLSAETGETAVLTVRHGLHAVCVSQVESAHEIRLAFRLGQLLPLYAGAGQRVLLAFAPTEVRQAVLSHNQRPYTPETPTRDQLVRQVKQIRAQGLAISKSELINGSFAVAMPVLVDGIAIAGVCLAGPRNRCTPDWQTRARAALSSATASMAQTLAGEANRTGDDE